MSTMAIRKRVPVSKSVSKVEFSLTDTGYPFVGASTVDGCQMMLEEVVPRGDESLAEFYSVTGAKPDEILKLASEHGEVDAALLDEHETGGLFEFVVGGDCPALFLSEQGALPRSVYSEGGKGHIAAEIPPTEDPDAVVDRFLEAHPDAELENRRKQPFTTPMFGHREHRQAIDDHLSDERKEVLAAAHEAGYYEWPRETTCEEIAAELSLSTTAVRENLRGAEQKLIAVLADESPGGSTGDATVQSA